jgi:hypothetical protein
VDLQELSNGRGEGDERCASIQNDTGVVHFGSLVAKCDSIKINLPVGLTPQRNVGELATVLALINTTESSLGLLVGVAEVEGKDRLVKEALIKHVVERWDDLVDRDGVVSQTHDTVEPSKGKSKTRLGGSLGKVLTLDLEIANLEDVV